MAHKKPKEKKPTAKPHDKKEMAKHMKDEKPGMKSMMTKKGMK